MNKSAPLLILAALAGSGVIGGCESSGVDDPESFATDSEALTTEERGEILFKEETFDGNGRACSTCHTDATGTITPEQIQAAFDEDPNDPLFRAIDSDDGDGATYERLRTHALFRVEIPLPANVILLDDPEARSVVLFRSTPTVLDTPALDPVLMWDGRQPTLESQAIGAVDAHYDAGRAPTAVEASDIAAYELTLFTSERTQDFAETGCQGRFLGSPGQGECEDVTLELPEPTTAAQGRGKAVFDKVCAQCHAGNMLNGEILNSNNVRFDNARVSEVNRIGLPVHTFRFIKQNGQQQSFVDVTTPDPGRALVTGSTGSINRFKIPSLHGISRTAPYFHDNSAATLREVVDHYGDNLQFMFKCNSQGKCDMTEQQRNDLVEWLQIL